MKLTVTGYLSAEIGLGQAARNYVLAAAAGGFEVELHTILHGSHQNQEGLAGFSEDTDGTGINISVMPLPDIGDLSRFLNPEAINILVPYWEIDHVHPEWARPMALFREVWAPSTFIAGIMTKLTRKPVRHVRQAVVIPETAANDTFQHEKIRVLTFMDFDSFYQRKNPGASISAFMAAFPRHSSAAELIVKVRGDKDRGLRHWLLAAARRDGRIRIIDQTMSRAQVDQLISWCDVYLSLHRAEGFGFGAAEAMAAGKAVLSTDYSGTTDFVTAQRAYPIPYDLQPVRPTDYANYAPGQQWAAPSVTAAAATLRRIASNRLEARIIAARARKFMVETYSFASVGAEIRAAVANLA